MSNVTDISRGAILALEGEHWRVLDVASAAHVEARIPVEIALRCLRTGATSVRRFRGTESVEIVSVETRELQYLYAEDGLHHFMDTRSFEQAAVEHHLVDDALPFVRENDTLRMELVAGRPVGIVLPDRVELEVAVTGPGTPEVPVSNVSKDATLETGLTIRVPLFVEMGDRVRVDTRTGQFVERVP